MTTHKQLRKKLQPVKNEGVEKAQLVLAIYHRLSNADTTPVNRNELRAWMVKRKLDGGAGFEPQEYDFTNVFLQMMEKHGYVFRFQ